MYVPISTLCNTVLWGLTFFVTHAKGETKMGLVQ